jgi:ATP-dependent DNA helicase RecQ
MQIISCIKEVRSRYGINVVAGILAGSDRAKLREYHVESYEAYGALRQKSEPEIKQIIQYLLLEGFLDVTADKYALLRLTEKAKEVSEEGFTLSMKKSVQTAPAGSLNPVRKSDILNTRGMELFEELRTLRTQLAREKNLPPYLIFSDRTLMDMCIKTPLTEEAMFTVNGVGQNKFDRYGAPFMEAIRTFTGGVSEKLYFGEEQGMQQISTGKENRKMKKAEFYLTKQQAEGFPYTEQYLATELAETLSSLREEQTVKKLTGADIFRLMQAKGYASESYIDGMRRKTVSLAGQDAGLFIGMRMSKKGTEYEDIYYGKKAQRMIVEEYVKPEG